MSMVERVAEAIRREMDVDPELADWVHLNASIKAARAAIEAMREPTDGMIAASPEEGVSWDEHARGFAASYYRAMIDAALKE